MSTRPCAISSSWVAAAGFCPSLWPGSRTPLTATSPVFRQTTNVSCRPCGIRCCRMDRWIRPGMKADIFLRTPAAVAANSTPAITGSSGNPSGARGETGSLPAMGLSPLSAELEAAEGELEKARLQLIAGLIGVGFNGLLLREQTRRFVGFAEAQREVRAAQAKLAEAQQQAREAQRQLAEARNQAQAAEGKLFDAQQDVCLQALYHK